MHVASQNVAKYNNLNLENFFISNEVNGEIKILDLDELTVNDITSLIRYFTNNISDFFG